jgi:toxin ParE1/3/4
MRIRYTDTALNEVNEIFSYLAERNFSAAVAVRERIERTTAVLAVAPEMAQETDEPGVRRIPVRSYPYVSVEGDEIVVLHVRHSARRPLETNR